MTPHSKIGAKALASEIKRQRREQRKITKQCPPELENPAELPTICPAQTRRGPKVLRRQWRMLKAKCKLLSKAAPKIRKDKRRAKGFIDPMLTRDGVAASQPHRTRRSPSRLTKFSR